MYCRNSNAFNTIKYLIHTTNKTQFPSVFYCPPANIDTDTVTVTDTHTNTTARIPITPYQYISYNTTINSYSPYTLNKRETLKVRPSKLVSASLLGTLGTLGFAYSNPF